MERLRNASLFIEQFAVHPLASVTDPRDRAEALRQASKFPRTGTQAAKGAKAPELFDAHWRRPILLKVLKLGDFKRCDPVGYGVLSRTREHKLFNRLNNVLTSAQTLPSRSTARRPDAAGPA